jgi:hypothetical protein
MQLNSRQLVTQFAHMLQEELFPLLQTVTGLLGGQMQLLASAISLAPLGRLLSARRAATGRPAKDRAALATAFMAKAILNLPTTRDLISRLQVHEARRQYCGWRTVRALPHESKFSRAFAEFAQTQRPQQLHEAVIAATQQQRLIGHIARDSTAIPVRERYPETEQQKAGKRKVKKKGGKAGRKKGSRGGIVRAKAADRGTRIQRQRHLKLERQLQDLPQGCDRGAKTNSQAEAPIKGPSQGREQYGRSYKLHLDVADGQIPVSAVLTSASVYDSQVAIPLMTMTSGRVVHLYELMDSAYDADAIHAHSRQLNHVPRIAPHPRRGTKKPSQMQKVFPDKPTPQLTWAQQDRYKERTMSGRVNARLKDEFGASHIRVRGAAKVMAHLMFGVLALTIDPWLRLGTPG